MSYREEEEKLNVWASYMKLESKFGTPESLQDVLKRALQQNEKINVYKHLIEIYKESGKITVSSEEWIHTLYTVPVLLQLPRLICSAHFA